MFFNGVGVAGSKVKERGVRIEKNGTGPCVSKSRDRNYFTNSISLGRQVLSIHGSSGPYMRKMVNQLLPGTVCNQFT